MAQVNRLIGQDELGRPSSDEHDTNVDSDADTVMVCDDPITSVMTLPSNDPDTRRPATSHQSTMGWED